MRMLSKKKTLDLRKMVETIDLRLIENLPGHLKAQRALRKICMTLLCINSIFRNLVHVREPDDNQIINLIEKDC